MLHDFCNRSSPDDRTKSDRKNYGYIQLWTIHKSLAPSPHPEYDKSNTDPEENIVT